MKKLLIFLLCIGLSSCALFDFSYYTGKKSYKEPEPPKVEVVTDEFDQWVTFLGIKEPLGGNLSGKYFIRSFVHKQSKEIKHQIYVDCTYKVDWRFYKAAYLSGGIPLEFTSIDTDFSVYDGDSTYYEQFGAIIPNDYIHINKEGFSIKATSKSGYSSIITITEIQIREQLATINEYVSKNL